MSESDRTTRRTFIKSALGTGITLAAAGQLVGCTSTAGRPAAAPLPPPRANEGEEGAPERKFPSLRVALIGTGGIGGYHLENAQALGVQVPCYCDVDTKQFEKAAEAYRKARPYQDYRQLFDKEHKNFDAVMIGTPDHHHYPATIIAMQLGKHVYTQKPLTHTVWEARQLSEAAKRYKVATQMGNQGHAGEGWRLAYEWYHGGALGQIKETHTWTNRPIWPQGIERPKDEDPVPSNLDWDVWLGPAPVRPFKQDVYHRFNWRGWWDFGAGALGDMACHMMDGIFWTLDPGYPSSIEPIAATPVNNETFPKAAILKWQFPAKGLRPAFTTYWYDGCLAPPSPLDLERDRKLPPTGNLWVGSKASLAIAGDYGESPRIIPEAKMKKIGKPKQLLERSPGHIEEWMMAATGEKPLDYAKSNFAYAGPFTEAILLGNIALRMNRRLEWDGARMEFKNAPEANQYVTKEYRVGWRF